MKFIKQAALLAVFILIGAFLYLCWNLSNRILVVNQFNESTRSGASAEWSNIHKAKLATLPPPVDFQINAHDD